MAKERVKTVPEWLVDLVLYTIDKLGTEEEVSKYLEYVGMKQNLCTHCQKDTYELIKETTEVLCLECKKIKTKPNELF